MKERINRLAKGILDTSSPEMSWSPEMINESVRRGSVQRGEIAINSVNSLNVRGFVYSGNRRVRISKGRNAFGGTRNRITYEVDTSACVMGDTIEGSFYLVTNCGEKEIPFHFTVEESSAGPVISGLKTAQDFCSLAERDRSTAMRLLEYRDFTEAPFMQDLHVRAIYDGLREKGIRSNFLEEFLIALEVKAPIRLMADDEVKTYANPEGDFEDTVTIRRDGWGFVYLEAFAEGDFLKLPVKSATQDDFIGDAFRLPFRVVRGKLHAGVNYGVISVLSARGSSRIEIQVTVGDGIEESRVHAKRKELTAYLKDRLSVTVGKENPVMLRSSLQRRCERLEEYLDSREWDLLRYDLDYCLGKISGPRLVQCLEDAGLLTGTPGDAVECLATVLALSAEQKKEDLASELMVLEMMSRSGFRSPFLYALILRILEEEPKLLRRPELPRTLALLFGIRKSSVSRELALEAAAAYTQARRYKPINLRMLMGLYHLYPEKDILTAVCAYLIRGDCREERFFPWYERAVEADLALTRLNEYFLFSMPENYGRLMPKEVLYYFSYAADLNNEAREKIYQNLLLYGDRESDLFRGFTHQIDQFAYEQIAAGRINRRLSVIYKETLSPEMIDKKLAFRLPSLLAARRITCRGSVMSAIVVRHQELMSEDVYQLKNDEVYVPVFSDRDIILFQDAYGQRYMDVHYKSEPALPGSDYLVRRCFEEAPEHPFLLVNECIDLLNRESLNPLQAECLKTADRKLRLHPLFRKKLLEKLITYYEDHDPDEEYLMALNKDNLSRKEKAAVCAALIRTGHDSEALDMYLGYYLEEVPVTLLSGLFSRVILTRLFSGDEELILPCWQVFSRGAADGVITDYLCGHFNRTSGEMYNLLKCAIRDRVDTYDLEERLTAQMLFTGETGNLDSAFELYVSRRRAEENIVRAYFTVRSYGYFLRGEPADDRMFLYLEQVVAASNEKEKFPDIYLLALTKHYSELPKLSEEQRGLCQTLVNLLISEGFVFAYYKDLARFIIIPGNIMDKEIVEYRGERDHFPKLLVRILPEEEEYHSEEMRQMYRGIYIYEKVLFEGEILEYRVVGNEDSGKPLAEGSVSCRRVESRAPGNRFAMLNDMSLSLELGNENALREKMEEYIARDRAVAGLFTLE